MSKQSKSSAKASKTSKKQEVSKTITLNLSHLIFLHGLVTTFPKADLKDQNMKRFLHDLTFLFEIYIDGVDDDELKKKFNYKPQQ